MTFVVGNPTCQTVQQYNKYAMNHMYVEITTRWTGRSYFVASIQLFSVESWTSLRRMVLTVPSIRITVVKYSEGECREHITTNRTPLDHSPDIDESADEHCLYKLVNSMPYKTGCVKQLKALHKNVEHSREEILSSEPTGLLTVSFNWLTFAVQSMLTYYFDETIEAEVSYL